MPKIYRAMMADGELPRVGAAANMLGVRTTGESVDIAIEDDGTVAPGGGGLSVAPNWRKLPPSVVPTRLRPL